MKNCNIDIESDPFRVRGKQMKTTLVIMAAGLGSRYGGNKQTDGVGPRGEMLLEYSIYDAIRAGFNKVILIIKPDMIELMDGLCMQRLRQTRTADGQLLEVGYAFQSFYNLPEFYTVPDDRTKPFGTVHALLCARNCVKEPFCVINADDYYGVDAYRTMYEALQTMPEEGSAAMVGYLLKNTVSPYGDVTRGICHARDGRLEQIRETMQIRLLPDGSIADTSGDTPVPLDSDSVVSMNFWGFQPSIFDTMSDYFDAFLHGLSESEIKAECLLPIMVGDLVDQDRLHVQVLTSHSRWFGMTYHEDRAAVTEELRRLHESGVYPPTLKA